MLLAYVRDRERRQHAGEDNGKNLCLVPNIFRLRFRHCCSPNEDCSRPLFGKPSHLADLGDSGANGRNLLPARQWRRSFTQIDARGRTEKVTTACFLVLTRLSRAQDRPPRPRCPYHLRKRISPLSVVPSVLQKLRIDV